MTEARRKHLHLVLDGLPEDQRPKETAAVETFVLKESNAREALEKIFAAEAVSVWGFVEKSP